MHAGDWAAIMDTSNSDDAASPAATAPSDTAAEASRITAEANALYRQMEETQAAAQSEWHALDHRGYKPGVNLQAWAGEDMNQDAGLSDAAQSTTVAAGEAAEGVTVHCCMCPVLSHCS